FRRLLLARLVAHPRLRPAELVLRFDGALDHVALARVDHLHEVDRIVDRPPLALALLRIVLGARIELHIGIRGRELHHAVRPHARGGRKRREIHRFTLGWYVLSRWSSPRRRMGANVGTDAAWGPPLLRDGCFAPSSG